MIVSSIGELKPKLANRCFFFKGKFFGGFVFVVIVEFPITELKAFRILVRLVAYSLNFIRVQLPAIHSTAKAKTCNNDLLALEVKGCPSLPLSRCDVAIVVSLDFWSYQMMEATALMILLGLSLYDAVLFIQFEVLQVLNSWLVALASVELLR